MTSNCVVVVEDDPELGELIVEALSGELDCCIRLFANGSNALDWLASDLAGARVPELLFLDIHLPGVSGLEILDFVKSEPRYANTRIVMSSSDSVLLDRARGKADWLLLKPAAYSHFIEICRWYRDAAGKDDYLREKAAPYGG